MKKSIVLVTLMALGAAAVFLGSNGDAVAGSPAAIVAPAVMTLPAAGDHAYLSARKCKMCHKDTFKSWETTVHAKAFEILKPENNVAAKKAHGLDPAKDYTKDEFCLPCHTTGYGKDGGYAIPTDEKSAKKMSKLEGVGCEMCHGPGKDYIKVKKSIKKEKRKYKFEELAAAGMLKAEAATCKHCHNDKGPTFDKDRPFNFEERKVDPKAIHAHQKLKLRED